MTTVYIIIERIEDISGAVKFTNRGVYENKEDAIEQMQKCKNIYDAYILENPSHKKYLKTKYRLQESPINKSQIIEIWED